MKERLYPYIMSDEMWLEVASHSGLTHNPSDHSVDGSIGDIVVSCWLSKVYNQQRTRTREAFCVFALWPLDLDLMVPTLGEPERIRARELLRKSASESGYEVMLRARAIVLPFKKALRDLARGGVELVISNDGLEGTVPLTECSPKRLAEIVIRVTQVAQAVATERPTVQARSDLRREAGLLEPLARELNLSFSTCPLGMSGSF